MSDTTMRAKALLEGIRAPEPWEVRDGFVYPLSIRCGPGGIWEQDAEFIAAAPSLIRELVAEIERLTQ